METKRNDDAFAFDGKRMKRDRLAIHIATHEQELLAMREKVEQKVPSQSNDL